MKRTELFSLRRSVEEVQQFAAHKEAVYNLLEEKSKVHIVSVTEVDRHPLMIAEAFRINHEYDDSTENYIFLNAIDTENSSLCLCLKRQWTAQSPTKKTEQP